MTPSPTSGRFGQAPMTTSPPSSSTEADPSTDGRSVVSLDDGEATDPALTGGPPRRDLTRMEDWNLDHVQIDVRSMEELPPAS